MAAVIRDVVIGLLIAGAVAAWVPDTFWQHLFLTGHPLAAKLWGPLIGPVISVLSFVCSIGNVPLAAVLWNGGISFGGVVAFIFADLIIIPILIIYRKYYGTRMMLTHPRDLLRRDGAGRATPSKFAFGRLGLIPAERGGRVAETGITWNYTTILNIVFLLLAACLGGLAPSAPAAGRRLDARWAAARRVITDDHAQPAGSGGERLLDALRWGAASGEDVAQVAIRPGAGEPRWPGGIVMVRPVMPGTARASARPSTARRTPGRGTGSMKTPHGRAGWLAAGTGRWRASARMISSRPAPPGSSGRGSTGR